jgi:1-deoxy-D-xylulose-5-phosphate synthase
MTLPDRFIAQAAPDAMYADAGLTAIDIAATAAEASRSNRNELRLRN